MCMIVSVRGILERLAEHCIGVGERVLGSSTRALNGAMFAGHRIKASIMTYAL